LSIQRQAARKQLDTVKLVKRQMVDQELGQEHQKAMLIAHAVLLRKRNTKRQAQIPTVR